MALSHPARNAIRSFSYSLPLKKEIEFSAATAGGHGEATDALTKATGVVVSAHGELLGGFKLWRNISFFVGLPAVGLCMLNAYLAHQAEHAERPEFVKYDYLRVRTKKFPWADGNHSLFHNPHTNALPDGYEDHH